MSIASSIAHAARRHGAQSHGRGTANRGTIPASVKGLNSRDALSEMTSQYAITMRNYFPELGRARLRRGSTEFAAGVGTGDVESLISHVSGSVSKIIACGGGTIQDITVPSSPVSLATGQTGNRWNAATYSGHTIMVNGADDPVRLDPDGTLNTAHGWTGTGLVPANLSQVMAFKNRLFFAEKDTANIWYGGVAHIQGELVKFPVDRVHTRGGNIVAMGSMTIDAGDGVDDMFVIAMSSGAVLIYQGTDISEADRFFLRGIYQLGAAVGDRPFVQLGGDLIMICADGFVPLSSFLQIGRQTRLAISDTIAPSVSEAIRFHGGNVGWQAVLYSGGNWLLFNVPSGAGTEQFVMNTQTAAWCVFAGLPAKCWLVHDDKIYFGAAGGQVRRADHGLSDVGLAIEGDIQSAYRYIRGRGNKRYTMMRALLDSDASISYSIGAGVDYEPVAPLTVTSNIVGASQPWNSAPWNTFKWGGRVQELAWQDVGRSGTAISVRLRTSTKGARVSLYATDILYEPTTGIL